MEKFNKSRSRTAAKRFETDLTAIIYNSLVHDVPKHKAYGQIKREIAYFASETPGLSVKEKAFLWSTGLKMYSLCAKQAHYGLKKARSGKTYQERLEMRSKASYDAVRRIIITTSNVSKAETEILNRVETRYKSVEVKDLLKSESESIFFLCDVHEPCASDHKDYQGRLYIRSNWENYIDDPEVAAKINSYLHNHPIMMKETLEWVLGLEKSDVPSPYLIRRPNCKHHLLPVSVDEVLHSSVKKLLYSKKLIKRHEEPRSNANRYHRAYMERLETLHSLWKVMPNKELGDDIAETKRLMRKWGRLS